MPPPPAPYLEFLDPRPGRARVTLAAGAAVTFGRSGECDVPLDCERASRRHAQVLLAGGRVSIEDLGSTRGTKVNGRTVMRAVLSPGDEIEIGTVSLRLVDPGAALGAAPGREERLLELLTDLLAGEDGESEARLTRMLAGLTAVFEADRGALFLPGEAGLERRLDFRRPGAAVAEDTPVSRRLVAKVAASGEAHLLTTDLTEEMKASIRSIPRVLRSVLACPLPRGDAPGVLYLDSAAERREFAPADRELLLAFGRAAGVCLDREADRVRAARLGEVQRRALAADKLLGTSPAMGLVRDEIAQAAGEPVTVLVTGESGTGKELVARALHRASPRADGPFVAVNCGAIPPDLVESELFGHERGAFTGAAARRLGQFELADGGTLFLDEIGELPPAVQTKLLRVLQERQVRPVGASRPRDVDFRLVAATHVDLEAAVKAGRFREDLFYRVAVFRLRLPPLRERDEDVLELAEYFLTRFARRSGRPVAGFAAEVRLALKRHPWPGNIRELRNVIEQAVVRTRGPRVEWAAVRGALGLEAAPPPAAEHAAEAPAPADPGDPAGDHAWLAGFPEKIETARRRFEVAFLERALAARGGNMKGTAEAVGMSRRGLYDKCDELGIDYRRFRKKKA